MVQTIFFYILALIAILSAIGLVVRKNPVSSAMLLITHFIALSGIYLTLNAQFLAALQILVYAGAIMVLVVFVIMLLNIGTEQSLTEKFSTKKSIAVALSISLGGVILLAISRFVFPRASTGNTTLGTVESISKALFNQYVFPFEMVSLVLLAAAVGAVALTKKHLEN